MQKSASLEHLNLIEKRLQILVGGRIYERNKMMAAARSIDKLRRKVEGWDSVKEIRKWRESW
jgi:hypothetical protein